MITQQEVYDKVAECITAQGKFAIKGITSDGFPRCQYRAPDGSRCAAGCLIPDDKYDSSMENWSVDAKPFDLLFDDGGPLEGIERVFARDLQRAHDSSARDNFPGAWPLAMKRVAERYKLSAAKIDEKFPTL